MNNPFIVGRNYSRQRDIHDVYGGSTRSGISSSSKAPFIFLFTSGSGKAYGYHDGWDGEAFRYYGEGQLGDMAFTRGNKAFLEHALIGKSSPLSKFGKE